MVKKFRLDEFGYEVEIGKVARQADGAVWFKHGGTVILSTVVSSAMDEFPGFLPLTVDYRESQAAAGKIPGGYFKREGKSTDKEVLTSRLIDRAVRPLFPARFFDQVQLLSTVYSVDKINIPNAVSLLASSLALAVSNIPFLGPVGVVEVGRINGEWIINPNYEQSKESDVHLVIAGTAEGICMVEGAADQISENEFVDALFLAHDKIKVLVEWQKSIQKELGIVQDEVADRYGWATWEEKLGAFLTDDKVKTVNIADKVERGEKLKVLKDAFLEQHEVAVTDSGVSKRLLDYVFESILQKKLTELIFAAGKRIDGRAFDQVRSIENETGLLPFTHGSSLFTRGRTQALVSVTLGGGQDEQKIENIMEEEAQNKSFMLHYNFPPFSVGETRPMRGPGRREVGHGYLAASAFNHLLPDKESFPYTIRLVSDILESDGSSSMATACGSTMALMDAGVPLKKMVSGIAMGLLKNESDDFIVLSDISGFEDAFGLMDFKVVGTEQGITAIQMDIKYKGGLSRDVFTAALEQARKGRAHIMSEMQKVMKEPKKELSSLVPKVITLTIPTDKIGAIIGSGGKTIREIIETTGTNIDIESDGLVKIFGSPGEKMDLAINWVKTLAGQINSGAIYTGKIRRIVDFGLFVELVPGMDGLVHVSMIPRHKQKTFMKDYQMDTEVTVEVVEYDKEKGRVRLRLIEDNK